MPTAIDLLICNIEQQFDRWMGGEVRQRSIAISLIAIGRTEWWECRAGGSAIDKRDIPWQSSGFRMRWGRKSRKWGMPK